MFRNKDFDDYVDHSYFDHLGLGKSDDHQLVKSEKNGLPGALLRHAFYSIDRFLI